MMLNEKKELYANNSKFKKEWEEKYPEYQVNSSHNARTSGFAIGIAE